MRALLQVLATLFAVEQRRTSDPRNVLEVRASHTGLSFALPFFHLLPEQKTVNKPGCQHVWVTADAVQQHTAHQSGGALQRDPQVGSLCLLGCASTACCISSGPPGCGPATGWGSAVAARNTGQPISALQRGGAPAQNTALLLCRSSAEGLSEHPSSAGQRGIGR